MEFKSQNVKSLKGRMRKCGGPHAGRGLLIPGVDSNVHTLFYTREFRVYMFYEIKYVNYTRPNFFSENTN